MIEIATPKTAVGGEKWFIRLDKYWLLTDLISVVKFYVEEYSIWDYDPNILIYQNINDGFYAYISWTKDDEQDYEVEDAETDAP